MNTLWSACTTLRPPEMNVLRLMPCRALAAKTTARRCYHRAPQATENALKRISNENKELVLSILKLTTTRRETRFYLDKYATFNESAVASGPLRLALLKLRGNVLDYDEDHLKKFSRTLDYMKRLGASPVILLDADFLAHKKGEFNFAKIDNLMFTQFNHLNRCLSTKSMKLTPIRSMFSMTQNELTLEPEEQILHSLGDKHIPVLFPYAYDTLKSREWIINSTDYLSNLTIALHSMKQCEITVEKLIFIDKLGGVPSIERSNNSHVFINLEQEFDRIQGELQIGHLSIYERGIHHDNLIAMHKILTSVDYRDITGIITTLDIANENLNMNPIIYNILTDRAVVSSSLPTKKFSNKDALNKVSRTSVIKKGLNVLQYRSFKELDMVKFKALIDDSFKRSLDLEHFLTRVEPILDQIIIVGDYDGIAIITREKTMSGVEVAYLDKFAISRDAQGSLGVADMIFNLLKSEYKNRLLWRSKKINPVNGWYFQRSSGSLGLHDSEFRIFWTKPNVTVQDLENYVEIGKNIEPSWKK